MEWCYFRQKVIREGLSNVEHKSERDKGGSHTKM